MSSVVGLKGRDTTAQGAALGKPTKSALALKGRDQRPFRAKAPVSPIAPGLRPGLSHYGPSGLRPYPYDSRCIILLCDARADH